MPTEEPKGTLPGSRFDDIPFEQRYCNECNSEIEDTNQIGDCWALEVEDEKGRQIVILCRDCA